MEFYRFLSFVHDDFPNPVRGMDRTTVGLHASRVESGKIILKSNQFHLSTLEIRISIYQIYLWATTKIQCIIRNIAK